LHRFGKVGENLLREVTERRLGQWDVGDDEQEVAIESESPPAGEVVERAALVEQATVLVQPLSRWKQTHSD
jgi:hypothetical protein